MDSVERALVVVAHPDDVDFGAAGTVAAWTDSGTEVAYCIVTDGDAGGFDLEVPRSEIPQIRRAEQRRAAETVGVLRVEFLGHPDGRLTPSLELRRDVSRVIRAVRPQRVLCPSPERLWRRLPASHPDHLAAGEATLSAVYPDARNPFAFPELLAQGFEPHVVSEVWMMASPQADQVVDITDTFDRKIAALLCHVSQLHDPAQITEFVRSWTSSTAQEMGLPEGRLGEAFFVIQTG